MYIQFTAPPLPHYIVSGISEMAVGDRHPNRQNIGVFDLLVASKGCLYIADADQKYEVHAGQFLILRPDSHHYSYMGCKEESTHHWLHFQLLGDWSIHNEVKAEYEHQGPPMTLSPFSTSSYKITVPQFAKLPQLPKVIQMINTLTQMNSHIHLPSVRLKQQALFQEVILLLSSSGNEEAPSPQAICAERAASYLREHYREPFSSQALASNVNFHPVYIARCMKKVFGCSPSVYLIQLRVEQAKLLLLQTNLTIERIAEEVGFNQAAYFTACFKKFEGISPRKYRQRFTWTKGS
ncbi:AraC family transcriptional regulator [Paenibacillus turicensis]|uniref:helix-turn-helix domain-containing protein n=1 Tax=Paenibacillus turicensis TaxID=160487 RepID=UPI003D2C01ED